LSELRKDYLEDYVALVAPRRVRAVEGACPYCRGSEKSAPPSPVVFRRGENGFLMRLEEGEEDRVEDWDLKVLPYHAPLLTDGPQSPKELTVPFRKADPGAGVHYVIVPTPEHGLKLSQLDVDQMVLVLLAIQEFGKDLYQRKGINYVAIYYEERSEGGEHPLVHVLGLPEVPPAVEREYQAYRKYLKEIGTCPLCVIAEVEKSGPRELLSNEDYISIFPWAPMSPFEAWVLPRSHRMRFYRLTLPNMTALAQILLPTMRAMSQMAHDYCAVFYTSSLKRSSMNIHWSVRLHGGEDAFAGISSGYGIRIMDDTPEDRAKLMAKHARKAFADIVMGDRT
jgi:UDPglucose--hexose-1-phosphate uridylyltransferase